MILEDFFETSALNLRLDSVVPFDCFIRIKDNGKFVHWMRESSVFTANRQTKLAELEVSRLWIMKIQREKFQEYVAALGEGSSKVSGGMPPESELLVIKGGAVKEATHRVFGNTKPLVPKNIMVGFGQKEQSSVKSEFIPQKSKVDAAFINVVIASVERVFSEQFAISVTSKPPTKRTGEDSALQVDIASFIGLTSQSMRGTVGLCFPMGTYFYLLKQVTGFDFTEALPEYCVGSAEIMSSIFEIARPQLINIGYDIDLAIPTFVVGKNLSVSKIIPDRGFSIVFEVPGGSFQFDIGVKTGT